MSSQKTPLSASKRAVPIKIQILNLSDRDSFPYSSVEARWSFTMNLMPLTKIKELCIHAAGQVQRAFNAVVDGAGMEARDSDGHIFHGQETISEETLNGETIFLIDGGLGKAGEGTGKGTTGRERGRLLSLQSEAEQAYRTPSVSSRSSSTSRRRAKSQPRMTPSQRVLAIAQSGAVSRSEPKRARSSSSSVFGRQALPSPSGPSHKEPAVAPKELSEGHEDASNATVDNEPTAPNRETSVDKTSVLRSPRGARSTETSPRLQDSQKVIPNSQDLPSGSPLQPPSASRAEPVPAAVNTRPNASEPSQVQARSAPRLDTLKPEALRGTPTTTRILTSRPDPYDISTVVSDNEENNPLTRPANIMSSPIRKLGSASKRRAPASQPPLGQPQLSTNSPSRTSKSATAHGRNPARDMDSMCPATPTRKTPRPIRPEASSPLTVLPSSPTNNVVAAIAKGRNSVKRQPIPEVVVIDDSVSDIDEELFRNPPGLSTSIPHSLEASLPWSQPPLRAAQDLSLGVGPVSHRDSVSGLVGATAETDEVDDESDVINSKADVRRLIDAAKMTLASVSGGSGKLKAKALPSDAVSPFKLDSPVKTPPKRPTVSPAGRTPNTKADAKQPIVTIIRGSSSEDESDEVGGGASIVKQEASDNDAWKDMPPAAPRGSISLHDRQGKEQATQVIELSSDSESPIDQAWLDEIEAELPVFDEPIPSDPIPQEVELPVPVIPVQVTNDYATDPVRPPSVNESPPSAQPDKRKWSTSDEPDSEDERKKKRVKRAEKRAKREAKRALRILRKKENMARVEEERKRLALEQAHRRALELEMVVSSPSGARQADSDDTEGDEDSGLEPVTLDEDEYVENVRVPQDGDDEDIDSSPTPKPPNGPSLLRLSRNHPLPSPKGKQDNPKNPVAAVHPKSPASRDAHTQQQKQQHSDSLIIAEKQYHRRPFDDWAALEATLGSGNFGYSPLEVHNRVHLAMVHRSLQAPKEEPSGAGTDNASPESDATPLRVVKTEPGEDGLEAPRGILKHAADAQVTPRSIRPTTTSPKNTTPAPRMASTGGRKKGKDYRTESRRSYQRERNRLRQRDRYRARHCYSDLRNSLHSSKKRGY